MKILIIIIIIIIIIFIIIIIIKNIITEIVLENRLPFFNRNKLQIGF